MCSLLLRCHCFSRQSQKMCVCAFIYIHAYRCMHTHVHRCICMHTRVCIQTSLHIYVYIYVNTFKVGLDSYWCLLDHRVRFSFFPFRIYNSLLWQCKTWFFLQIIWLLNHIRHWNSFRMLKLCHYEKANPLTRVQYLFVALFVLGLKL